MDNGDMRIGILMLVTVGMALIPVIANLPSWLSYLFGGVTFIVLIAAYYFVEKKREAK